MMQTLEGVEGLKTLVIGAASGIGSALAQLLETRGAQVIRADRDARPEIDLTADITRASDCEQLIHSAVSLYGGLDAIVVTAGGGHYASIAETGESQLMEAYRLNVAGPALLVRAALPALRESKHASVVVCASAAGLRSYPNFSAYGSAKAALIRWIKGASWELASDGIRVNCVSPGPIDTPMLRSTQPEGFTPDEWVIEVAKNTAMGRSGRPEEVAEALAFLVSHRSSYLTGVILPVDGGEVA